VSFLDDLVALSPSVESVYRVPIYAKCNRNSGITGKVLLTYCEMPTVHDDVKVIILFILYSFL
jgi:hypothetical protein